MLAGFEELISAIKVSFRNDCSNDAESGACFLRALAARRNIKAVMNNGSAGEVFSLALVKRAEMTFVAFSKEATYGELTGEGLTKPRWRSHPLCNHESSSDGRLIWRELPHCGSQVSRDDCDRGWRSVPQ